MNRTCLKPRGSSCHRSSCSRIPHQRLLRSSSGPYRRNIKKIPMPRPTPGKTKTNALLFTVVARSTHRPNIKCEYDEEHTMSELRMALRDKVKVATVAICQSKQLIETKACFTNRMLHKWECFAIVFISSFNSTHKYTSCARTQIESSWFIRVPLLRPQS